MCLAVPGKIIKIDGREALIEYPGETQKAYLGDDIKADVGDFVLVQMGVIVKRINKPITITAGEKYNDIDALACAVAYEQLLTLQEIDARIILPGPLNESVTATIRNWDFDIATTFQGKPEDFSYVMVDVSEPSHFAKFVKVDQIIEIYDHRNGFEQFWQEKLGTNAKIEKVGACATLIWEEFKNAGLETNVNKLSANLLYTAILSNTLNLQAQITTTRDKTALKELTVYADLPEDWRQVYFDEVSQSIMNNPIKSMVNDTKVIKVHENQYQIIQLELWDNEQFINDNYDKIIALIKNSQIRNTFFTSPNISKGFNYIITTDDDLKKRLTDCIKAEFDHHIGKTNKLWLRKEIMRLL
ncbi:HypC/HybG/HupF family hydrogenase formation chaperone [Patescibacteria group bacterium]|nr:HypC/HybG/HupF family hydrogenase formation chaperone [Patescibacteria group bacterium]